MFLFEETAQGPKTVPFASDDSERCRVAIYWDEYEVRGLRCGLFSEHSGYHLSKPEESGGMSRLWTSLDFGFTLDYMSRPSDTRALAKRDPHASHSLFERFKPRRRRP